MGPNQQPLIYKPIVLPSELCREICGVGFKLLLYSAIYSYNVAMYMQKVLSQSPYNYKSTSDGRCLGYGDFVNT